MRSAGLLTASFLCLSVSTVRAACAASCGADSAGYSVEAVTKGSNESTFGCRSPPGEGFERSVDAAARPEGNSAKDGKLEVNSSLKAL